MFTPPSPSTRRFPRAPSLRPMLVKTLADSESHEELTRTRVIGGGGCSFETTTPLGYSSLLEVFISLGGRVVRSGARVAWEKEHRDRWEVGVEFVSMSLADREQVRSHVERLSA